MSSRRISGSGEPDQVFESRIEESDGSGMKRVIVERGLGSKAMKLTQVSDGSGGKTEERVFTNVSKEEETLFDDSHWPQAAAKLMNQTPAKALPASLAADTPHVVDSITPQDSVPTPAEPEVDESGVPIAASFDATEGGGFHETGSARTSSPAVNDAPRQGQQDDNQQQKQQQQQQQQQQQVQPLQQQQQHKQGRRTCSRHRSAVDMDPFSRQILSLHQLSRALNPNMSVFDIWSLERPGLHYPFAFAPVYDPFADAMVRHPLIDVRF